MKNWIFFTGAPGSRWSGVSQTIRDNWENVDNTDLTEDKKYTHHKYSGHVGNYYGPGMANGQWLEESFGTNRMWEEEINKSYSGPEDSWKLILSHNFAYYLEQIKKQYPDSKLVMCYRPDKVCYDWWHEAGGWDISWPDYSWYENNNKMWEEIVCQNRAILEFVYKHKLPFRKPGREWFRNTWGVDRDFIFEKDVWIAEC